MLDGLLGRGFSAKCKSLIKVSRTRLDAIKRKRNAMLKYLKKDVADLLSNGLDINAYGRAEGLYNELNLSSCYDTVEHYCELIPKHLSVIQKQRECPEECREAISSLVFAAARFADLPELRDLRDTFTERFGKSLEPFVNKELVEKLASKPPSVERKLQLMRDIAQEFSIKWDSKAFQQKLASPLPTTRDQPKTYGTANEPKIDEKKLYNRVDESAHKRNNVDVPSNGRRVVPNEDTTLNTDNHPKVLSNGRRDDGKKLHSEGTETVSNNRDVMSRGRRELGDERYRQQKDRNEPILESNDGYTDRVKPHKEREHAPWKRETRDVLLEQEVYIDDGLKSQRGTDDTNSRRENLDKNSYRGRRNHDNVREVHNEIEEPVRRREKKDISSYREVHIDDGLKAQRGTDDTIPRKDNLDKNSYRGRRNHDNVREVHDNEMDEPVRRREKDISSHREHESPTIRQKMKTDSKEDTPFAVDNYKTANNLSSKGLETIRKPLPPPPYLKPNTPRYAAFESNIPPADTERNHNEEKVIGTSKVNGHNNLEHQDVEKKPKPKSVRRRHMRPPPRDDNESDEADVSRIPSARRRDGYEGDEAAVRRIPSARRREEKQGLQHALDGDRSTSKDEEERMMDKLLLHYSKKPTAFEPRNVREGRVNAKVSHHDDIDDAGEPQHRHRRKHKNPEPPSRATSLPPDPVTPTESERGPARANSFQPDMYNAGGHVHPRLPDYDDIHARFAALKGR